MALLAWGVGFYGPDVHLAALFNGTGWALTSGAAVLAAAAVVQVAAAAILRRTG